LARNAVNAAYCAALALAVAHGASGQQAGQRPLVYGGNSGFPPYEFLDANGRPQGFSVELVRAISKATGVPIEIRLAPWAGMIRAFESGEVDFVSLTRTPEREARFAFLNQYWTHRYVIGFAAGRKTRPGNAQSLRGEVIAVQRGSVVHELLNAIPEERRPALVPVTAISEAMPLLASGEVTAVGSSELTLRLAAGQDNRGIETITLRALPFHFAARDGHGRVAAIVSEGMAAVRRSGEYEETLERWVVDILPEPAWKRHAPAALAGALSVLLALAGIAFWNYSLRRQVSIRTVQLDRAVKEKQAEVEEHRLAEEALQAVRKDRESLINSIDGIAWERDVNWEDGQPVLSTRVVSDHAARMLGFPIDLWRGDGRFWEDHIHPDDRDSVREAVLKGLRDCQDYRIEYRMIHASGGIVWIRDVVTVGSAGGAAASLRGIMIDITSEKAAVEGLRENERRYRELVEGSPDAIIILWLDRIVYVNPAAVQMLGASGPEDLLGRMLADLIHPDYQGLVAERHALVRSAQTAVPPVEEKVLKLDGTPVEVEASAAPHSEGGKLMIRVILRDITKRKEAEQQLIHQAFHDPLTQLPNRALMFERLRHRMALRERFSGQGFAILFLDLDRFKLVNDSLGHWMGDLLLLHVRERIESVLDPWDTLARLGGDEFTILLEEVPSRLAVEDVSTRIHAALAPAIELGGHQIFVTASIGVAVSETGYEEAEELLRDADTAMYRAKAQGRAQTVFFDGNMRVSAVASLVFERDLRVASQSNQFVLHYQPVMSLADGRIRGVEALIRWNHPEKGLLLPSDFLARADEGGMILNLDSWALEEGCRQARRWDWLTPGSRLSVNVSGRSLLRPDFSEHVRRILARSGLEPEHLALEITEQVLVESTQCVSELERLRDAGVELYLDDFGTGYSSLSYLTLFPISRLKIDRSFIQKLEQGGRDVTVVRMVLALADGLGLQVTAEGVENAQQAGILRSMGCQTAQGHYFGRPVEAAQVSALANPRPVD
jgi:diguanylate cyclase (GGDEF)-like protein/PAS domain S-box-containing protein